MFSHSWKRKKFSLGHIRRIRRLRYYYDITSVKFLNKPRRVCTCTYTGDAIFTNYPSINMAVVYRFRNARKSWLVFLLSVALQIRITMQQCNLHRLSRSSTHSRLFLKRLIHLYNRSFINNFITLGELTLFFTQHLMQVLSLIHI